MRTSANAGEARSKPQLSEAVRGEVTGGFGGGASQAGQRPGEVAPGVDGEQGAGSENRVDDCGAPAGAGVPDKEEIFLTHGAGANGSFDGVGIDVDVAEAGLSEPGQSVPAVQRDRSPDRNGKTGNRGWLRNPAGQVEAFGP